MNYFHNGGLQVKVQRPKTEHPLKEQIVWGNLRKIIGGNRTPQDGVTVQPPAPKAPTTHITVTYKVFGDESVLTYAVNEDTLRDLRAWLKTQSNATGRDLRVWLENKGCALDCSDGPAIVVRTDDGSTVEMYYRNGKRHRDDGPAVIFRGADGLTTAEKYYSDGELIERPAPKAPNTPRAPGP
jgi:hypothetical protein